MQTLTINIQNSAVTSKVLWFLEHLKNDGVEVIEQDNIKDLKVLAETRDEEHIPFEKYLSNEN